MTRQQDLERPRADLDGGHVAAKIRTCREPIDFMRVIRGVAFLFAAFLALGADGRRADASETPYTRLLRSTALVLTDSGSSGTAWVADRERKLLVTNFPRGREAQYE